MDLQLVPEGHEFLKANIAPWTIEGYPFSPVTKTAEAMHEFRRQHKAVGLAANQVGLAVRMFVMGTDFAEFTCIDPVVTHISKEHEISTEGCLSFPGLILKVKRPKQIGVAYTDVQGERVQCTFDGLFARCFLHELDHLNGVTFDTKVSRLVLSMAKKKRLKRI